jgi:hypothetical protein
VFDLRRYSFCIRSVQLKSTFLFKNYRDYSNFPPHASSLKSEEMIAVEPEKQRIVFTSQNKMQEAAYFFPVWEGGHIASQSVPQVSGW